MENNQIQLYNPRLSKYVNGEQWIKIILLPKVCSYLLNFMQFPQSYKKSK